MMTSWINSYTWCMKSLVILHWIDSDNPNWCIQSLIHTHNHASMMYIKQDTLVCNSTIYSFSLPIDESICSIVSYTCMYTTMYPIIKKRSQNTTSQHLNTAFLLILFYLLATRTKQPIYINTSSIDLQANTLHFKLSEHPHYSLDG